jgi:hypothetical protein
VGRRCRGFVVLVGLAIALFGGAPGASAQTSDDPLSVVEAYVDALNAHDLGKALALFDQNGSATDVHGRHFQGRDGLTEFLLANGFGASSTRVATNQLQVFGNRALWTYTCTCSAHAADARVVLNHNKIIVFFMEVPLGSGKSSGSSGPSLALWVMVLALLAAFALTLRGALDRDRAPPRPRPAQGRLLAGLKAFKDA